MNFENKELKDLLESIRYVYGYDFTDYAEASVRRRILHFMAYKKIEALDEFGKMIVRDEKLFEEFIQVVSVTVTEMFRDPSFYKSLRENVMKRLATFYKNMGSRMCHGGRSLFNSHTFKRRRNIEPFCNLCYGY